MVFFAGFGLLAVFFWFMVPAYYCRALAAPRSTPQGVFNFSLDVEPFLKPGCPSIALTASSAIPWCTPAASLGIPPPTCTPRTASRHWLHRVYAKRRFQQKPSPSLEDASFQSAEEFSASSRRLIGFPPFSAGLCPRARGGVRVETPHAFGARYAETPRLGGSMCTYSSVKSALPSEKLKP